ncbi:hypothetical protein ACRAWC_03665 [Leifsonia sp. L25]|uniref:hypothetical protein n=1 Tax=Actinomycetes TaxID=1760 RepID=UPI003D68A628
MVSRQSADRRLRDRDVVLRLLCLPERAIGVVLGGGERLRPRLRRIAPSPCRVDAVCAASRTTRNRSRNASAARPDQ